MQVTHILLQNFSQFLQESGATSNTVKNYLADISVFFRFLSDKEQPISFLTLETLLSPISVNKYHHYLIATFPVATVKRRVSSLNKFSHFVKISHLITPVTPISIAQSLPSPLPPTPHSKPIFSHLFTFFILLTISASIMGGYLASRISDQSIIGLVDPSVTNLSYP